MRVGSCLPPPSGTSRLPFFSREAARRAVTFKRPSTWCARSAEISPASPPDIPSNRGNFSRAGNKITLFPIQTAAKEYAVAPDFSGACYFYALSLLCGARALVNGAHPDCGQTDLKLLDVLKEKGVKVTDTPAGMVADGGNISTFSGFDVDMQDFSDQTLTLAALAPFAATPSVLKNIGHIRKQECDRVEAILHNLTALGVPCECRGEDILIYPAPVRPATLESYGDHRVAMAFALVGLKADGIKIKDPECCKKTFGNYFEILDELTKK